MNRQARGIAQWACVACATLPASASLRCKARSTGFALVLAVVLAGCGQHLQHQVRQGDTLYSIGWRYGYDYRQIAEWNDLRPPYIIHQGQWLRVAPPGPQVPGGTAVSDPPPEESPRVKLFAVNNGSAVPVADSAATAPLTWSWPADGDVIGTFASTEGGKKGLDIAGKLGQPVYAAADGRVVYSGNGLFGYGNLIIVKHNERFLSAYGHNSRLLVEEGETVRGGQKIAEMGSSGAGRVMLHYEIRQEGKPIDPMRFLPKRGG